MRKVKSIVALFVFLPLLLRVDPLSFLSISLLVSLVTLKGRKMVHHGEQRSQGKDLRRKVPELLIKDFKLLV
jgi:hypothetical protein